MVLLVMVSEQPLYGSSAITAIHASHPMGLIRFVRFKAVTYFSFVSAHVVRSLLYRHIEFSRLFLLAFALLTLL
ncbi:MAG: hypothetical protein U5R30_21950 [Deltaproteobacteria bacterium]|nr:hypothetical protein [Deltaproteobacteria bacterium]